MISAFYLGEKQVDFDNRPEFLAEGRRRTDLIRWDAYVTEDWWDHKATNNANLNRFPVHYSLIGANNLLEQNPGY